MILYGHDNDKYDDNDENKKIIQERLYPGDARFLFTRQF